jgi:hypothetical protein
MHEASCQQGIACCESAAWVELAGLKTSLLGQKAQLRMPNPAPLPPHQVAAFDALVTSSSSSSRLTPRILSPCLVVCSAAPQSMAEQSGTPSRQPTWQGPWPQPRTKASRGTLCSGSDAGGLRVDLPQLYATAASRNCQWQRSGSNDCSSSVLAHTHVVHTSKLSLRARNAASAARSREPRWMWSPVHRRWMVVRTLMARCIIAWHEMKRRLAPINLGCERPAGASTSGDGMGEGSAACGLGRARWD